MSKVTLAASLVISGLPLSAQSKSPGDSNFTPVQTILTVEPRHDRGEVPALSREDVRAYEGHERRQVTDLVRYAGPNAPLELFLLLDDASAESLGSQLDDLRQFIKAQPATTAIGVGYMQNGTAVVVQNLTTDHDRAAHSVRLPQAFGGALASPYLSVSDLMKRWPRGSARRAVVMVTSGIDPLGGTAPPENPYLDAAIDEAQRSQIVVFGIYMPAAGHFGHSFWRFTWAQSHLAQLAEESGGESYNLQFGAPVSFAPYLSQIATRLANQYRVTFLMKPQTKGGFRSVRFSTEVPNAELVAPSKVYLPPTGG